MVNPGMRINKFFNVFEIMMSAIGNLFEKRSYEYTFKIRLIIIDVLIGAKISLIMARALKIQNPV